MVRAALVWFNDGACGGNLLAIRCKPGLRPWCVAARVRWVAGVRGGALGGAGERAGMTLRGSGRQPLPAKLSRADAGHLPECAREVRWIRVADLAGRIDHGVAGVGQQIGGNLESQVFDQVRVAEIGLIQPALQRADAYAGELGSEPNCRVRAAIGQIGANRRTQ